MSERNRDVRILRRALWALVFCAGALCALAVGFAILVKMF